MSLACLACHRVDSPTHSFRSHSGSSSSREGRCSAAMCCLTRQVGHPQRPTDAANASSKVTPAPFVAGGQGTPRLARSYAVTRDLVREWNFEALLAES